jgi:hypothetical protein
MVFFWAYEDKGVSTRSDVQVACHGGRWKEGGEGGREGRKEGGREGE